jgi:anti-sigma regulatory factor (Ser/Thr protein kinase)
VPQLIWPLTRRDLRDVSAKRHAFRQYLLAHDIRRASDLELIFGELITNAVRYGEEPMEAVVRFENDYVQIQVADSGACFDLALALLRAPSNSGGRGLFIVGKLSRSLVVRKTDRFHCEILATVALTPSE